MKMSVRLKYMLFALWDLIRTLFGFICKVGLPVGAVIGFIYLFNYFPWWVCMLFALGVFLVIYLWTRADTQYREDHEVSKMTLNDKYHEITDIWRAMEKEGKSCRTIYSLMTHMIDDYDALLEYHKRLYGEDDTYNLYVNLVDEFIKCREDNEKAEKERQEKRAAMLKEMGGNGDIYAIEGDLI